MVLRFANVYGPYSKRKSSVVARFLNDIMMGSPVTIHGDGAQTRDFVYVGDLCNAISAALSAEISGEVFQIATGQSTSVAELVDLIEIISKTRVERQFAPLRLADIADNYSVIEKANRLLHWKPATTLKEGLTKTWEWFTKEAC